MRVREVKEVKKPEKPVVSATNPASSLGSIQSYFSDKQNIEKGFPLVIDKYVQKLIQNLRLTAWAHFLA